MPQTNQGLANDGQTAHYAISYDTSLSTADGLTRAQQLMDACEGDFDLVAGWFPGTGFIFSFPIAVHIGTGSGGASWTDPPDIALPAGFNPTVELDPGSGTGSDVVRYLLVTEVAEMFMASKNNGWHEHSSLLSGADEGSKGEALARFLGFQFGLANGLQVPTPDYAVVSLWLNSPAGPNASARPNYVDDNPDDHQPDIITGCGTCFLHYLHDQLGYSIVDIINAGADTLGGVYQKLTGRTDGWTSFIQLVDAHYPSDAIHTLAVDNIFPVPNLATLDDCQIYAGDSRTLRILALDTQVQTAVSVELFSDNPDLVQVQSPVVIPAGDWAAGVSLQAAPVVSPEQSAIIFASYAGKSLSARVQVLPRASVLAGRVTDTSSNPLADASILIQSDAVIIPGLGNTLQLSTDADGYYQTQAIPPHVYQVSAAASGYMEGKAFATVEEGVPVTTLDFALAPALPVTVDGTITNSSGGPVPAAAVTLQGYKTTADPYGSYTITIPADTSGGDYTLTVNAVGYASSTLTFPIPNGATVTEDVVLAQLGALQGFVRVAGTTPGAPVAGATLTIGSQTTQSDATGHYQVSGLVPGYNDITVSAPGYDSVATSLFIVAGGTKAQDFDLTPGTAVLAGTVTDTDGGFPLADATITVAGAVSPASAAADGSYTVVGIPAGTAKVTAEAAEHVTQQTVVSFADQQTVTLDFSLDLDSHGRGHGHGGGGGWPPQ